MTRLTLFYRIAHRAAGILGRPGQRPRLRTATPANCPIPTATSMRVLRLIGYGFMALVLTGGWAFIYWLSNSVDLAAVEGARASLAELRAADAGWNQQLVHAQLPVRGATNAAPDASRTVVPS